MTDQTSAPERVWRVNPWHERQHQDGLISWPKAEQAGTGATEYVRGDVAQAMVAAALEQALKEAWFLGYEHKDYVCDKIQQCAEAECAMLITPEQSAALDRVKAEARKEERERCAKIAEDEAPVTQDFRGDEFRELCDRIAAAIRAEAERDEGVMTDTPKRIYTEAQKQAAAIDARMDALKWAAEVASEYPEPHGKRIAAVILAEAEKGPMRAYPSEFYRDQFSNPRDRSGRNENAPDR